MANRTIVLKNVTNDPIVIRGRRIPANDQIGIYLPDREQYAQNGALMQYIDNGDIVVNDGTQDLPASLGKAHIQSEIPINPTIPGTGSTVIPIGTTAERPPAPVAGMMRYNTDLGNIEIYQNTQWSLVGSTGSAAATSGTLAFVQHGGVKNRWLHAHNDVGQTSDRQPAILPFPGRFTAVTFTNDSDDASTDLELYVNGSLEFTWTITTMRNAWKSSGINTVTFNAGDEFSVFLRENGNRSPQQPKIVFYWMYTDGTESEGGS